MSEKSDEKLVMYQTVNWQSEISAIAGPVQSSDTRESWLARAARKSGSRFWHIKALFYGQLTDPKYSVAFKVLSAAEKARINAARSDMARLSGIYQTAAGRLNEIDPDFHRNHVDALLAVVRELGSLDSSGTEGGMK